VAACREKTPLVVVDTTGLIAGELGTGLKIAKIRAVAPSCIIAIQREEECEPILAHFGGSVPHHHRLAPSPLAQKRSPEVRARTRREKLAAYFAAAGEREHLLATERVELFRLAQPANLVHQDLLPGTVLGLNHGEETRALGVVIEADKRSITLRTPLPDLKGINRVVFGDIVLE
ncbi:MAG TPA: Clp1/GlmU family protein, partial [Geobacteraceae bacterium]